MRIFNRFSSRLPIEIVSQQNQFKNCNYLNNIGAGGLACASSVVYELGALVVVKIPNTDSAFEGAGVVVWCEKVDPEYEIGIQFIEEREAFAAHMAEQICQIEHYRKQVFETQGLRLSSGEAAREWIEKFAESMAQQERCFIRHPVDIPIEISRKKNVREFNSELSNLSLKGACVILSDAIEIGDYVRMKLPQTSTENELSDLETEGVVVWCHKINDEYEIGIEFVAEFTEFHNKMLEQIKQINIYKQNVLQQEGRKLSGKQAYMDLLVASK